MLKNRLNKLYSAKDTIPFPSECGSTFHTLLAEIYWAATCLSGAILFGIFLAIQCWLLLIMYVCDVKAVKVGKPPVFLNWSLLNDSP